MSAPNPIGVECMCGALVGESCRGAKKAHIATFHYERVLRARAFAKRAFANVRTKKLGS